MKAKHTVQSRGPSNINLAIFVSLMFRWLHDDAPLLTMIECMSENAI